MSIWNLLCLTPFPALTVFQGAYVIAEATAFSYVLLLNRFLDMSFNCLLSEQLTAVTYWHPFQSRKAFSFFYLHIIALFSRPRLEKIEGVQCLISQNCQNLYFKYPVCYTANELTHNARPGYQLFLHNVSSLSFALTFCFKTRVICHLLYWAGFCLSALHFSCHVCIITVSSFFIQPVVYMASHPSDFSFLLLFFTFFHYRFFSVCFYHQLREACHYLGISLVVSHHLIHQLLSHVPLCFNFSVIHS